METSQKTNVHLESIDNFLKENNYDAGCDKSMYSYLANCYPQPDLRVMDMALCSELGISEEIIKVYADLENKELGSVIIRETSRHKLPLFFKKRKVKNTVKHFYETRDFTIENLVENDSNLRILRFDAVKDNKRYKISVNHDTSPHSIGALHGFGIYSD